MAAVVPIDLLLGGMPGAAAAYLVTGPEPCLVDPGPPECLPRLRAALLGLGVPMDEVRHVLVTHAHREHAGGVGFLVEEAPGILVHCSAEAAEALSKGGALLSDGLSPSPSKRESGEEAEDAAPVPQERLRVWRPGGGDPVDSIAALETPGHTPDHLTFLVAEPDVLLAGDALGVVLTPESPTHLSAPPGGVDPPAWRTTLDLLGDVAPAWVAMGHFGLHDDPGGRVKGAREALDQLEERVARAVARGQADHDRRRFREQVVKAQGEHLPEARVHRFFERFDPERDWEGVRRALDGEEGGTP